MTCGANMKKPQIHTKQYYDWVEITNYLENKYGKNNGENAFWDEILGFCEISNGCDLTFEKIQIEDDLESSEAKKFANLLFHEFAKNETEISLYIWW